MPVWANHTTRFQPDIRQDETLDYRRKINLGKGLACIYTVGYCIYMSTQTSAKALNADVATADVFDVVLDSTGNLWVRSGGMWSYVTEGGLTDCDDRRDLPECYEPYMPLDAVSAKLVLRGIR
jgi:hypothetical protein